MGGGEMSAQCNSMQANFWYSSDQLRLFIRLPVHLSLYKFFLWDISKGCYFDQLLIKAACVSYGSYFSPEKIMA